MSPHYQRKTIRLQRDLYQEKNQAFSITVCTYHNIPLLKEFGGLIFQEIMGGPLSQKSDLMAVCIMPDHIHLLLAPISENLVDLIGKWKGYTTHLMWKKGYKGKVWQRSFYDHALRKDEDLIKVAEYTLTLHKVLTIPTWASRSERLRGEPLAESALSSPSPAGIHLG